MLRGEIIAVYSEKQTEHVNTAYILRGNAELWNVEYTATFSNPWNLRVKNTWEI
jgi:hypothetical protein